MSAITEMLKTHPSRPHTKFDSVAACLSALVECDQICTMCADSCLEEAEVASLRQCIRLNQDCADLCAATARMLERQARPDPALWRATLEAAGQACRSCSEECARHEGQHGHCKACRLACDRCELACGDLLQALPRGGAEISH